jgi:monoamine oxidase
MRGDSRSYPRIASKKSRFGVEIVRTIANGSRCNFAGEHCSQDLQGFMEGGASEGLRAANEILGDLKKT